MRIVKADWLFSLFPSPGGFEFRAITTPWAVFVHSSVGWQTLAHESVHVMQIKRCGVFGFYSQYLWEFLMGMWCGLSWREAYLDISFEVEARDYVKQLEKVS